MFVLNFDSQGLLFYSLTLTSMWLINYITIKHIMNRYNVVQNEYGNQLLELEAESKFQEKVYNENIHDFAKNQESSYELDTEQLTQRSNNVIANIENLSKHKQLEYDKTQKESIIIMDGILDEIFEKWDKKSKKE